MGVLKQLATHLAELRQEPLSQLASRFRGRPTRRHSAEAATARPTAAATTCSGGERLRQRRDCRPPRDNLRPRGRRGRDRHLLLPCPEARPGAGQRRRACAFAHDDAPLHPAGRGVPRGRRYSSATARNSRRLRRSISCGGRGRDAGRGPGHVCGAQRRRWHRRRRAQTPSSARTKWVLNGVGRRRQRRRTSTCMGRVRGMGRMRGPAVRRGNGPTGHRGSTGLPPSGYGQDS